MKIGIIGSGNMGAALGRQWAKHGHLVMFSYSRTPERLQNLVSEIGSRARSGTPEEAVRFANVLLLSVPWASVGDALLATGSIEGKILLSCVNPCGPDGLEVGLTSSAAEEIAKLAPGAIVIEAFNTIFVGLLQSTTHLFGNSRPTLFYCGDDRNAKLKTAILIRDAGLAPVDAGPLKNSRYIELKPAGLTPTTWRDTVRGRLAGQRHEGHKTQECGSGQIAFRSLHLKSAQKHRPRENLTAASY